MKKFLYSFTVNLFFGVLIIIIAIVVTTISLTKKINDFNQQYQQDITVQVQKNDIPILSLEKGVIEQVYVQEGQEVKKGELLVKIANPVVEQQIRVLNAYPDNVSAKTQVAQDEAELQFSNIYSPVNGIIGQVNTTIDAPVDEYTQLLDIYQSDNTKLLAYLSDEQYLTAIKMSTIPAFDQRLNQDFYIAPDILNPNQNIDPSQYNQNDTQTQNTTQGNTIAIYFKLVNPSDANSLLNGEVLQLNLLSNQDSDVKPIDYFVNFWNDLLK